MKTFVSNRLRHGGAARTVALVVAVVLAIGGGVAHGHAHLESSTPPEGAIVTQWPETVHLKFTEPVEVRSSMFKVYPLDVEGVDHPSQLNAMARTLFEEVLPLRRDEEHRVDAGIVSGGSTADEIAIAMQEDGTPGTYVVMWRVLSVDTHVVSGFYVFTYAPSSE